MLRLTGSTNENIQDYQKTEENKTKHTNTHMPFYVWLEDERCCYIYAHKKKTVEWDKSEQQNEKKRNRLPPTQARHESSATNRPRKHKIKQHLKPSTTTWQHREQQYPHWGLFNHPSANTIQLLLDLLHWPPTSVYTDPNRHRGQRRQKQRRQQHQWRGRGGGGEHPGRGYTLSTDLVC